MSKNEIKSQKHQEVLINLKTSVDIWAIDFRVTDTTGQNNLPRKDANEEDKIPDDQNNNLRDEVAQDECKEPRERKKEAIKIRI